MTTLSKYMVVITFIWIGFVLGISFMEAPLKFRAPLVNLRIGLSIGRVVFQALNIVEICFSMALIVFWCFHYHNLRMNIVIGSILAIVLVQTVYLLPALSARALAHINQKTIASSSPHIYYIIAEMVKVVLLFILGFWQLKLWKGT